MVLFPSLQTNRQEILPFSVNQVFRYLEFLEKDGYTVDIAINNFIKSITMDKIDSWKNAFWNKRLYLEKVSALLTSRFKPTGSKTE
ncbi:hypothetical protein AKJ57_01400 [candidate division MSBL1 archaeon SCGC-AAA259A05]|uniref:Uncharacterized protein n=1 Tax=candidate division MSBL1 archaeon SCGC-AAA259A05 TaxID=1698259 RepID=A0A133UB13_9EURY|nr:hypothetical protein AKJ57_01400 [candidate division MSBL1 archaeon SCGC-AAA259A05]